MADRAYVYAVVAGFRREKPNQYHPYTIDSIWSDDEKADERCGVLRKRINANEFVKVLILEVNEIDSDSLVSTKEEDDARVTKLIAESKARREALATCDKVK